MVSDFCLYGNLPRAILNDTYELSGATMTNSIQRLEMRVDEKTKQMAERASAAAGCSLTEYVTRLIREDAPQVLKTQTEIELANEQFDRFIDICKANKAPSPRILDAANRLDDEGFE